MAVQISEELARQAELRAAEAASAADRARLAAEAAQADMKEAYQAAADAARSAAEAARDNARAKRASLRAKESARLARESAASARNADAQARRDAQEARAASNQAYEDARIAGLNASQAEGLAADARNRADQALKDADDAQRFATEAQDYANVADQSAKDAAAFALESAEYAKKANQYADEAQAEADRLEAEIRASENADLDQALGGWSAEMLADAKDYLTTEQFASIEPFIAASKGDVSQFLVQYGPQLIGEFFNVDDIKGCFSGKVLSCLILVAEQLGPIKAFKALKLLYKTTKAIKGFWDAVKKARKVIRNVEKKLGDCKAGLIKDIAGDLVGAAAGKRSATTAAAPPKKKCKVKYDDDDVEVYYRAMEEEDWDVLNRPGGKVRATAETCISPTAAYSTKYRGVLTKLTVKEGTTAQLEAIGLRDDSEATRRAYPNMPAPETFKGWWKTRAFFKGEGPNHINICLGRGTALAIFNRNLVDKERLR
ncbi:MAG TPA: hypothetical protein VF657_00930, partial [Actinoplanes sp.]